jgi:hypothetical protein
MIGVDDITSSFIEEAGAELLGRWIETCLALFMPENHGAGIFMLRLVLRVSVTSSCIVW